MGGRGGARGLYRRGGRFPRSGPRTQAARPCGAPGRAAPGLSDPGKGLDAGEQRAFGRHRRYLIVCAVGGAAGPQPQRPKTADSRGHPKFKECAQRILVHIGKTETWKSIWKGSASSPRPWIQDPDVGDDATGTCCVPPDHSSTAPAWHTRWQCGPCSQPTWSPHCVKPVWSNSWITRHAVDEDPCKAAPGAARQVIYCDSGASQKPLALVFHFLRLPGC
ncbi:PREDICTED: uncharacterized protein LOC102019560 isoform X2 [Chinchilla lanigera]|uniref:uncharacterized protein LOC102019560 isoform X2 n=1 Tax=Chinchilla lanigera TaxID=34839 RepID=UPI00069652C0|nr:PREDICTED: uncharacterized protein LOC102019560 isoform X2 [Chinchilla lanigera]